MRHGLVNGLNAVAHGELVNNVPARRKKVHLPGVLLQCIPINIRTQGISPTQTYPLALGQLDDTAVLVAQVVEQILMRENGQVRWLATWPRVVPGGELTSCKHVY